MVLAEMLPSYKYPEKTLKTRLHVHARYVGDFQDGGIALTGPRKFYIFALSRR